MTLMVQPDWPEPVVQIELFTDVDLRRHLNAAGPPHFGESHGAQEDRVSLLELLHGGRRHRVAVFEIFTCADGVVLEREADAVQQRFNRPEHLQAGGHHFGTDAIAAEHCNFVLNHGWETNEMRKLAQETAIYSDLWAEGPKYRSPRECAGRGRAPPAKRNEVRRGVSTVRTNRFIAGQAEQRIQG